MFLFSWRGGAHAGLFISGAALARRRGPVAARDGAEAGSHFRLDGPRAGLNERVVRRGAREKAEQVPELIMESLPR